MRFIKELLQSGINLGIFYLVWPRVYARMTASDASTLGEIEKVAENAREQLFGGIAFSDILFILLGICVAGAIVNWLIECAWDWFKSLFKGD